MKVFFKRKALFLLLFCVSHFSLTYAQIYTKEMRMPYYSQKTGKWCWAASMKMIMDFHTNSNHLTNKIDQCTLVKDLLKLTNVTSDQRNKINAAPCCDDCSGGCGVAVSCLRQLLVGAGIPFSYQNNPDIPVVPDNYDLLFSQYGYSSIQEINRIGSPIQWERIVNQIETCRPFIINIDPSPTAANELDANHALVINGYQEGPTENERFVIGYDPWKQCCPDINRVLFPYNIFERTNTDGVTTPEGVTYLVNRVLSTVHSIQSGTMTKLADTLAWESCSALQTTYGTQPFFDIDNGVPHHTSSLQKSSEARQAHTRLVSSSFAIQSAGPPPPDTSNFVAMLKNNAKEIAGYTQPVLGEEAFDTLLNKPENFYAPVKYMSSRLVNRRYFLSCLCPPAKLEQVLLHGYEVKDIVSGKVDKQLVSTFQKREDNRWALRKIATYTSLEKGINVRIPNKQESVLLNNQKNAPTDTDDLPFELIKYLPFQYEFFSFEKDGEKYLAPAADYYYEGKDQSLVKHTAYKEKEVIRFLRKQTFDYEKAIKLLFPKGTDYKEFFGLQSAAFGDLIKNKNAQLSK